MKNKFYLSYIWVYFFCFTSVVLQSNLAKPQDTLMSESADNYKNNIGLFFYTITDDLFNSYQLPVNFNYKIGIRTNIKLTNGLSINTGFGYGHENYDLSGRPIARSGMWYPSWFDTKTIRTDYQLRFDITRKNKKIVFYGIGGTAFNINLYERYDYRFFVLSYKKMRVYNCLFVTGTGIEYTINKVALNVETVFITPIWTNSQKLKPPPQFERAYRYTYRLGINIGLIYKFNKNIE